MRSITTNGDYYKKIFQLFCRKCRKTEVDRAWAEQVFPRLVIDKMQSKILNKSGNALFSLGIGSGTGEFESSLLRQISMRYKRIHHTVVEPVKSFIERYQSLLLTEDAVKDIQFDWKEQTMQTFQKDREEQKGGKQPNNFHFISAVHSLYYASDMEDTIRFFYDLLDDGGVLMIAVTTDQSSNTKFIKNFPVIIEHNPHITVVNSSDVERSLKTLGLPYDVHAQSSSADISSVFDESSAEGNYTLHLRSSVMTSSLI
ncbi:histamine N-methyltransferase-like [Lytechinus pictus]|uniref:histamine N-methyltransferase-like n=1 Tax=Lytechinus pictus TaxID=7653 RepID=UPI0030BA11EB